MKKKLLSTFSVVVLLVFGLAPFQPFIIKVKASESAQLTLPIIYNQNNDNHSCDAVPFNTGCAITSVAIVFRYYNVNTNPEDVYIKNGYSCSMMWSTIASHYSGVNFEAIYGEGNASGTVAMDYPTRLAKAREKISQGYPVIIYGFDWFGASMPHAVVAYGYSYDSTTGITQFTYADPNTGTGGNSWSTSNLDGSTQKRANAIVVYTGPVPNSTYRPSLYGDFDGDGKKDLTFLTPNGTQTNWNSYQKFSVTNYPQNFSGNDVPVLADYDGDGITDYALFNKTTAYWNIILSRGGTRNYHNGGVAGEIALAGDVDGDGKAEAILYRQSEGGMWYYSTTNPPSQFMAFKHGGAPGDIPVLANFDKTGLNPTIFRPSEKNWYERKAGGTVMITKTQSAVQAGDIPVPADLDGDTKTDLVVYRPSTGYWYITITDGATLTPIHHGGAAGDVPIAADFDGDGHADLGIFRPSQGVLYYMDYLNQSKVTAIPYGQGNSSDIAGFGKFSANGPTSLAVFRSSEAQWYIASMPKLSTLNNHGTSTDQFVPGHYKAANIDDKVIFRPSEQSFYAYFSNGDTYALKIPELTAAAVAVPGDYDKDGKTDFAVWDYCKTPPTDQFCWYYYPSATATYPNTSFATPVVISINNFVNLQNHGGPGDIPVPADYDGDGITDRAIFRASDHNWWIYMSRTGDLKYKTHGGAGDIPIAADINLDGRADLIIYRQAEKSYYYYLSTGAEDFASNYNTITFSNATTSDLPIFGKYDDDQLPDFGTFNPSTNVATMMFSNISMYNQRESFWIGNLISPKPL